MLQDGAQHCSPELEIEDFTIPPCRQQDQVLRPARRATAAGHDQEEQVFRTTKRPFGPCRRSEPACRSHPVSQYSPVSGRHDDMPAGACCPSAAGRFPLFLFYQGPGHPVGSRPAPAVLLFGTVVEPCHRHVRVSYVATLRLISDKSTPPLGSCPFGGQMARQARGLYFY